MTPLSPAGIRAGRLLSCAPILGHLAGADPAFRRQGGPYATDAESSCRSRCPVDLRCTTRRRNAHGTEAREVLYPWHPWAGCHLHIHEKVKRAGSDILRCSKTGATSDRWLEIPAWMFDRAACALARGRVVPGRPGALSALAKLLRAAKPVSTLSISRAASGPHDPYSGGLNVTQVHDVAARSVLLPT